MAIYYYYFLTNSSYYKVFLLHLSLHCYLLSILWEELYQELKNADQYPPLKGPQVQSPRDQTTLHTPTLYLYVLNYLKQYKVDLRYAQMQKYTFSALRNKQIEIKPQKLFHLGERSPPRAFFLCSSLITIQWFLPPQLWSIFHVSPVFLRLVSQTNIWGLVWLGIQILPKDCTGTWVSPATSSDDWTAIYSESNTAFSSPILRAFHLFKNSNVLAEAKEQSPRAVENKIF